MIEADQDGRVRLRGCLDMLNTGELVTLLAELAARHTVLTIDLAGVSEADSAALALLLNTLRAAHGKKHQINIENWPQSLRSLLSLYSLDEILSPSPAAGEK